MVLAITLGACSQGPAHPIACVLGGVDGDFVRQGDSAVLVDARWNGLHWERLALRLPAGWTVRPTDGSELEVFDAAGVSVARTGTHASLGAVKASTAVEPLVTDGVLEVCPT